MLEDRNIPGRHNPRVSELLKRAAAAQREADALCAQADALMRKRRSPGGARSGVLRRIYPALLTSVPLARAAVVRLATQAKAGPAHLDAIRLAVSEAMTNAVVHAYPSTTGAIYLTAAVTGDELTVLLADDGVGPRARARRPGKGSGWPLMTRFSDKLVITERGNGGTLVEIRWNLSVAGSGATAGAAVTAEPSGA